MRNPSRHTCFAPVAGAAGILGATLAGTARSLRQRIAIAVISVAACLLFAGCAQQPSSSSEATATMVFRNGPVYTVNDTSPWASAVAIRGSEIVYVGDDAGVQTLIGPGTEVVDLDGRLLMPGFVEAHVHPMVGATVTQGVDLQFNTREDVLAALRRHKATAGDVEVVRGFGWRYSAFPDGPTKADLDAIWPDTPVILIAVDAHSGWVNSRALELAGITRETPDPMPGFSYFKRDAQTGEATGLLVEVPAMLAVLNAAAPFSAEVIADGLKAWLPQASAAGITSILDPGIQVMSDEDGFGLYTELAEAGQLPFRVVGAYYHNNPDVDPIPHVQALRKRFRHAHVRVDTLKLNMDGVESSRTAAMLAPYADMPDTRGEPVLTQAQLDDIVRRADAEGIDIHVHAIGDRATRMTLDAIEQAIEANPPRDRRHSIGHLQAVDASDLARFATLGVIGQFSVQWAVPDVYWSSVTRQRWGDARARSIYRYGSLLNSGARIAFGTDWPAASHHSTFNPMLALEVAVTRREPGQGAQSPLPPADERISIEEAIRASTLSAAYQLRLDDQVGSIDVGKRADLIVLDRNLLQTPADQIHTTRVLLTVMDGIVRHRAR